MITHLQKDNKNILCKIIYKTYGNRYKLLNFVPEFGVINKRFMYLQQKMTLYNFHTDH